MDSRLPVVYFARMDVEASALRRFEEWYATKHGPDLLEAGFFSAQAYHCRIGGPLVCNVYEIPSSEIFYTDEYNSKRTAEHDPERPWILDHVSNRSNTAYEQVVTDGVVPAESPWGDGVEHVGAIAGPVISILRFDAPDRSDDQTVGWGSEALSTMRRNGAIAIRLCRRAGRLHPSNPSSEPSWALLFEWDTMDQAVEAQTESELIGELLRALGSIDRPSYDVAERRIALRRA
jgi:hypothetical protein